MKEKAKMFLFCPSLANWVRPTKYPWSSLNPWRHYHLLWDSSWTTVVLRVWSPRSASSAGNLSEMQIIRPYSRPTKAERLGVEPCTIILTRPPGDSELPKLWEPLTISFFLLLCSSFLTSQAPSLPCLTLYLIYEFSSYLPAWWPVLGSLSCLWPWNILEDIILYKYRMN